MAVTDDTRPVERPTYFNPGDQVELRSGGLPLTVVGQCEECGEVEVAYTDSEGDIVFESFPSAALKPYVEEPSQ